MSLSLSSPVYCFCSGLVRSPWAPATASSMDALSLLSHPLSILSPMSLKHNLIILLSLIKPSYEVPSSVPVLIKIFHECIHHSKGLLKSKDLWLPPWPYPTRISGNGAQESEF